MPEIHPSHFLEEVGYGTDARFCSVCEVCECHGPETLKKECQFA